MFSVPVAMMQPMAVAETPIIISIPVYISAYASSVVQPAASIVLGLDVVRLRVRHATYRGKRTGACAAALTMPKMTESTTLNPRSVLLIVASILELETKRVHTSRRSVGVSAQLPHTYVFISQLRVCSLSLSREFGRWRDAWCD